MRPVPIQVGDTITVKLPKLPDFTQERLQEFIDILSDPIDSGGSAYPQLIVGCLAKRCMYFLLLGKLDEALRDLEHLLGVAGAPHTCS